MTMIIDSNEHPPLGNIDKVSYRLKSYATKYVNGIPRASFIRADLFVESVLEYKNPDRIIDMLDKEPHLKNEGLTTKALNLIHVGEGSRKGKTLRDDIFLTICYIDAKKRYGIELKELNDLAHAVRDINLK